jgi:phosphoribosylformylglycinamidine cyclo-ligase
VSDAYEASGVDYDILDAGKRLSLSQAAATSKLLLDHGGRAHDASRGEPAFVFSFDNNTFAFVLECLGTKSVIARRFEEETGEQRYAGIAYDTVAAIVNDLCCVGALPLVVNAYFSTGSSKWYEKEGRLSSLVDGWRRACEDAGATWGGGESPTLSGLVAEDDIELAGSAVGYVPDGREPILGAELEAGDDIVLVASSGLHANGASLVRAIADDLPDGLRTALPSGRSFGDATLDPTANYVPLVRTLLSSDLTVTYLSHITGHGIRKVMRAARPFVYRIEALPEIPEVLRFVTERSGMEQRDAYGTLNMGAGYAVFCRNGQGPAVVDVAASVGLKGLVAGRVQSGDRSVVLEPLGVTYSSDELSLR